MAASSAGTAHIMNQATGILSDGAQMFANRLDKNIKHLKRWLARENIHCYRLYDADMPEFAIAIDVYEGDKRWVHVQEYQAPKSVAAEKALLRLNEAIIVVKEKLKIAENQLFLKTRRQQKGTSQYEKLASNKVFHKVLENGCQFLVNFEDYLDTGLFLDHRVTRSKIGKLAKAKRFLNLFAYTGTATVYAAKGGAKTTTTVDMSKTYLDWAKNNMHLNGYGYGQHNFVQANCLRWLKDNADNSRYDLIFLDPPSYSSSKRMESSFDVQRDHSSLIRQTMQRLAPGGLLIFSNNLRHFNMDTNLLEELHIKNITRASLPKDFERNPRIHNCWEIRHQTKV